MRRVALEWAIRDQPLPAAAALGLGPVARALGRMLLERPSLAELARVVAGHELLCLLAPSEALPWVDGVVYLGAAADGLFVPTTAAPRLPIELVVRALRASGHALPLALIPEPALIIPLRDARVVDRDVLGAWLAEAHA